MVAVLVEEYNIDPTTADKVQLAHLDNTIIVQLVMHHEYCTVLIFYHSLLCLFTSSHQSIICINLVCTV